MVLNGGLAYFEFQGANQLGQFSFTLPIRLSRQVAMPFFA